MQKSCNVYIHIRTIEFLMLIKSHVIKLTFK